jgi:hypothetical protein
MQLCSSTFIDVVYLDLWDVQFNLGLCIICFPCLSYVYLILPFHYLDCFLFNYTEIAIIAQTTNEAMNGRRFSYLLHPDDHALPVYMRRKVNPFHLGAIMNCLDFWTEGVVLKDVSW